MLINVSLFLPILYVCFSEIYCNIWDPRVWPETFVDDGKPFVEFTCGAYLKAEEWLSWYKGSDQKIIQTTLKQQHEGYRTINLLSPLSSLKNNKVYCSKENESNWSGNWRETKSKAIPINTLRNIEPINIGYESGPWLTPAGFLDNGKEIIEFTCYAYLKAGETLSWYQRKDKTVSKLGMIQQEVNYGCVKITLRKTLESSDNGSHIYCEKEGKNMIKRGSILLKFERHIEASERPYVTVETNADVAFFDEADKLEFVCSGSKAVDGRTLTWYLQTPGFGRVVPPDQHFCKSKNQNSLTLPMGVFDHGKLLYCAQDFTFRFDGAVTSIASYGEVARSRSVMLLHRAQCNKKDRPRVIPDAFQDDQPFFQFTCYAFLESGQLLSWYQSKGLNKSTDSLLGLVQLQNPRAEGEWVVLTLNKTLEPADNGSEIYCAKQNVLPVARFSDGLESQRVAITFQRDIPLLERPFIHVEPNTTIYFHPNTTVRLTCSGSEPVDGRNDTWFGKDPESGLTVPKDQVYDTTTNMNILDLTVNESCLMELFCAQGSFTGKTHLILTVAIPLSVLVLMIAAVACWLRRRRAAAPATPATAPRAPADRENDIYGNYVNVSRKMEASSQLTYAILDLKKTSHGPVRASEPALYAEISRVYNR